MSKATKIIAGLGVVAGLGVAALPMASYAVPQTVKGRVEVRADVGSAIAMTIVGNNDNATYSSVGVLPAGTDVSNYYTYDSASGTYEQATGTADGTTEYFRLPGGVSTYSPDNAGASIDGYLTANGWAYDANHIQTSGSKANILPNSLNQTEATSTITVYTNASGYTLNVQDEDANNALRTSGGTYSIPAVNSNNNPVEAGSSAWGFKAGADAAWRAVPTNAEAPASITPADSGESISVVYGISTDASQATGTYTDTIIYTAATNN